jgi:hypothetical protein
MKRSRISLLFIIILLAGLSFMANTHGYSPVDPTEKESTSIEDLQILYAGSFTHPGPELKEGGGDDEFEEVGTRPWVAHIFFVSEIPFMRADVDTSTDPSKIKEPVSLPSVQKVVYSFWTHDGTFQIKDRSYKLEVKDDANSNNWREDRDEHYIQKPVSIKITEIK